jgi:Bacterial HORMA domain family 1
VTDTITQTFNRDDIRRVFASFAADYKIVAEWTGLRSAASVERTIGQIKALAEEQYLSAVHMHLKSSSGEIRQAAVYRVSTNAGAWSSDRPGDLYWQHSQGDTLNLVVYFSDKWRALTQAAREEFEATHMPGWSDSDFDGNYGAMAASADRRYASRDYGIERTRYST